MSIDANILLTSLQQLEDMSARYDDILDTSVRNQLAVEGFCPRSEAESHLTSLKQEGRSLKVGVIGRVKAGKSSLINALLFDGKEVLPKAATPMTAALTSIGYAEHFSAKVNFFSAEDIVQIQRKAQEYDAELARLIQSYKEEHARRQESSHRIIPPMDEQRIRSKAQREIGEQNTLSAAHDLYQRIKSSGIDVMELGESRELTAESAEELNAELMNYVGSSGKYMPFTRELNLGMPLESLKGIEVIDTPGVNDPVKSREQRTYERLKECNAAFIVSPAGQFLSQQDFELADRLSTREGTQEIYLVASQADTQLHASLRKEAEGKLPVVIEKLKQVLIGQAKSALASCENDALRKIASQLSNRLIVTSGICETLLLTSGESSDSTAAHTMTLLKKNYSDYFSRPEDLKTNLKLLSARESLQGAVDTVRLMKEDILKQQFQHFIDAQWTTLQQVKTNTLQALNTLRTQIETSDKASLEQELANLRQASAKGMLAANSEFINQAENVRSSLPAELERVITRACEMLDEKSETAEGVEQENYRVEKDGLGSWAARKLWGGGYEDRTRSIATLKPLPIRRALEGLGRLMRNGMKDCATQNMLRWRADLISGISRQLRDEMGDDCVDITRLQSVCRNLVNNMIDLPVVEIAELPGELAKTNTIKGSGVAEYLDSAQTYATQLEKSGDGFVDDVRISIDAILKRDIGRELLSDLVEEMENMQQMVEHKDLTLEKISRMEKELQQA